MEFIIDRSKWRCGDDGKYQRGSGKTALLNKEGYMCCLGQCVLQENENLKILNCGEPCELDSTNNTIFSWRNALHDNTVNTRISKEAMYINDNKLTTQKEKESKLRELFKSGGHRIKFINKSVKI